MRKAALSYASVAEAYDRARPGYPADAVSWLVGTTPSRVIELGAGTGLFTAALLAAGHTVLATDPLPEMLTRLRTRLPGATAAVGSAEHIPAPSRSADVVLCAQSFHWFDHPAALPEIARVLRPGGRLAVVWNLRDEKIPWVRKLGRIIGAGDSSEQDGELIGPAAHSDHFGLVESEDFRYWQLLRRDDLLDLARSRASMQTLAEADRTAALEAVGELYDSYERGPDGLQLPYLTRCYRTEVHHQEQPPVVLSRVQAGSTGESDRGPVPASAGDPEATQAMARPGGRHALPTTAVPPADGPAEDTGTLLIDFR